MSHNNHGLCRSLSLKLYLLLACLAASLAPNLQAQITNILFSENFDAGTIDPLKLVPDAPFFEGGQGDIAAAVNGGVLEFTGTVSAQWWAGATMRVVPTFEVSDAKQIAVEVDRVLEAGVGSASRSALWIMDSTQTRYVLFAEVRGEGGWSYNRKIGVAGDSPTGGGNFIAAFDDLEDNGFHVMKAVADGKNVRLYLDDRPGPTVPFPFTNLVFHVGSYARANGDTAFTQFDNLRVYSIGAATFEPTSLTAFVAQTLSNVVVRIPAGLNATSSVQVRVVTSNPSIAAPVGATGDTLTLNFAAGATNAQTISINSLAVGGATFTIANDIGLASGNSLNVTVISSPGIQLEENFTDSTLDPLERNDTGFEVGTGVYDVTQANGQLTLSGLATDQYWGGISARTLRTFTATKELPLTVEVDRVYINRTKLDETDSTAARSSLWLTTTNHGQYIMFAQNLGENGWQVNVSNTGSGTDIAAFDSLDTSTNQHRMKLVADGEGVDVYLDGVRGGRFPFAVTSGLHVELGAYTRAIDDQVLAIFDNLRVENLLPCISVDNTDVNLNQGQTATVTVTIPRLLNATANATVTVTSANPSIAIPQGAVNGSLALNFAVGATNKQSFIVQTAGLGATTFNISAPGVCSADAVEVAVTAVPQLLFSDNFAGTTISNAWTVETTPLVEGGTATFESGVTITDGAAVINVIAETATLPGFTVFTTNTYSADATHPVTFEIDREKLAFTLVTGTAAKQLNGIWITDETRTRAVFFGELVTHDGSAGGWEYIVLGETNLFPASAVGTSISAFGDAKYNDLGTHRLRAVANGQTVKLYLDGILGAEVPFAVSSGIRFGFSTHVMAATDIAVGTFDDAEVKGTQGTTPTGPTLTVGRENGNIVITWEGTGTLQSASTLTNPDWTNVTTTGNRYEITAQQATANRFFRVVQ
jgi:hypothetical protein